MSIRLLTVVASVFLFLQGCEHQEKAHSILTSDEQKKIEEYSKKVSIADAVGQILMVGMPADINTVRDRGSQDLDEVLIKHHVGFAILKGYRYYDNNQLKEDEYLSKVIDFNNAIQEKASKGVLSLPLLIATDFEGPTISPVKRGLVPPPSALSLGATQDSKAIFEIGSLVGYQLRHIGIHILLGPVLDTYNTRQGTRAGLFDRAFAATPDGVSRIASHYINAVNRAGLAVFAKHFPSHGAIETDPHSKSIPSYKGAAAQRQNELNPFLHSREMIDGIMTAHIEVEGNGHRKLATFSNAVLEEPKNSGLTEQILITDDLSNMGAVRKYMELSKASYADVAVQAFDAGHDVLLFAHLGDDIGKGIVGDYSQEKTWFRLSDLQGVVEKLVTHISRNKQNETRFRNSLLKVLKLKAKLVKQSGRTVDDLLNKDRNDSLFRISDNGQMAIKRTEEALVNASKTIAPDAPAYDLNKAREQIVLNAIRKGTVLVNDPGRGPIDLRSSSPDTKAVFAIYEGELTKYKEAFSSILPFAEFLEIPLKKDGSKFRELETALINKAPKCDLLIYTALDASDADLLSRLRRRYPEKMKESMIVISHGSPIALDSDLIKDVTLIGNFTRHSLAFDVDIEILRGETKPSGIRNLPVNIGEGRSYNVTTTNWVQPANPEEYEKAFASKKGQDSCLPVVKENYYLIRKGSFITYALVVMLACVGYLIVLAPSAWRDLKPTMSPDISRWGAILQLLSERRLSIPVAVITVGAFLLLIFASSYIVSFFNKMNEVKKSVCQIYQVPALCEKKSGG